MSRTYGETGSVTYVLLLPGKSEVTVSCEVMPPHGVPVDLNDMAVQLHEEITFIF
jgi:hypothetical protein